MNRKLLFFLLLVLMMSILKLTSFAQPSGYPVDPPSPSSPRNLTAASAGQTPSSGSVLTANPSAQAAKPVTAYYTNWSAYSGYTPLNIPAENLTYLDYAFAKIGKDLKITLGDPCVDPANLAQLNQLKQTYPQLLTLISIGGWCDSGKFSDAALTDSSRAAFADSVVAFIKRYHFDGVDIDWEYPVSGGLPGNGNRSADKVNFTLLVQKLREKLDAQGKADGQRYLLTIAGGADSSYAQKTQLSKIADYVDYATIMTYDIHGPWDCYTDLNAPLYASSEASPQYQWSVDQAVRTWITNGFPASKIMLGIPFYGYQYSCVFGSGSGLHQRFQRAASISYDTVRSKFLSSSAFSSCFDSSALVPWLFDGSTFISYDNEASIAEKARYIMQNQLAGASVWELSQNRGGQLLHALTKNLNWGTEG